MSTTYKLIFSASLILSVLLAGCTSHSANPTEAQPVHRASTVLPQPTTIADRKLVANEEYRKGNLFSCAQQLAICTGMGDKSASTEIKLAACYQQLGERELAANQLLSALPSNKNSISLRTAYINALLTLGDFQDANAVASTLLPSLASLQAPDRLLLARAFVLSANPSSANRVLTTVGTTAQALQLKAQAMILSGASADAVAVLSGLTSDGDSGVWTTYLLAGALQLAGKRAPALKCYLRAVALSDCPADAFAQAALLELGNRNVSGADASLRAAPLDADDDPAIWLARTGVALQRHDASLVALTRGYLYYHSGDPWRAEKVWRAAIHAAHGAQARALYTAVFDSAFARHAANTAMTYVNDAGKRWPNDTRILKDQAEILLSLNSAATAERIARHLRTLVPAIQVGPVDELICRAALDAGDGKELQRAAARDEAEQPTSALPYLHLAEYDSQNASTATGANSALQIYENAAKVDNTNAQVWAHIGQLQAASGDTKGAIVSLLKAVNLDPRVNGGDVNAQLSALYSRLGMTHEAHYEDGIYQWQHSLVDKWQVRMKLMRTGVGTVQQWMQLGGLALNRHDNWVALCAFQRLVQIQPGSAPAWAALAAVWRRLGQFNYALGAMQKCATLQATARAPKS